LDRSGESLLQHAGRLRALAARLIADPSTADDLVQDTFVAALRHAPGVDRPLAPWLSRVIGNFARKHKRASLRREDRERALPPLAQEPTPDVIAERLEVQRTLIEVLDELDEPFRTTLVLLYFEDLSSADVARLQRVPPGTVRWRHKRGLEDLRAKLDRRFGDSRAAWCVLFAPLFRPVFVPTTAPPAAAAASIPIPEGVLAMSAVTKVVAVSLAVAAVAGVIWWQLDVTSEPATPVLAREVEIPAPPPVVAPGVAVEPSAEAPEGRAPARVEKAAAPAPETAEAHPAAAEHPRFAVEARFLDPNGSPWDGVRLARLDEGEGSAPQALSDSDGRARLEFDSGLAPGEPRHFQFTAKRDGCATVTLRATLRTGELGHLGDVVLQAAITLYGRVVDPQGHGIEGAFVGFAPKDLEKEELDFLHRQGSNTFSPGTAVRSDATGAFALPGVAAGTWRVWGKAEETRFEWTEPLEVRGDRDVYGLELVLEAYLPTDRFAGRVVDPKGRGVPGAKLFFYYKWKHESGTTTHEADEEGNFDFVVQREIDYTILASDPKGVWADSALEEIPPGSLEIVLELGERKYVEVEVRGRDEKPIENVLFRRVTTHPNRDDPAVVEPLSPGHYRLAIPNCAFSIKATARGYRTQELGPFRPESIAPTHTVTLERLPVVRGRVTADGKGAAGATVSLVRAVRTNRVWNGFPCVMESEAAVEVVTDASGNYEVECALQDEFWVRASLKGWADAERGPVSPPGKALDVDLELTHGGAIEGRVILADGKNAEGTIVGVNHGDARARTLRAGPEGRYRFDGLAPGRWQVVPAKQEIRPDSTTIRDEDGPIEIAWSCEVHVGRTTVFDLDLTSR
jgi:RNA polymerase sigma-70 factor (ECF subfamily)